MKIPRREANDGRCQRKRKTLEKMSKKVPEREMEETPNQRC